jgi:nitrite reductase (NADH) small subunit
MDYEWKNIGPLENIPVQRARRLCFGYQGRPIAIFRTAEEGVFALIDECPHKQGPLSEGIICGDTVTCPLHNWVWSQRRQSGRAGRGKDHFSAGAGCGR